MNPKAVSGELMKTCLKCKKSKEFSCFGKWKLGKDSLKSHYKDCRKLEHKSYYERQLEKLSKMFEQAKSLAEETNG